MVAALHNGGGGDQGQFGVPLEIRNGGDAAVAHGALDLVETGLYVVVEGGGIRDIGVYAFLEAQLGGTTQVIALPVPGPVGAFTPVFLHVGAVDHKLVGGALVKPGKIPAQHEEVRTHGQRQGHVVVMDNAAVRADGHVDAGLLKVFIPSSGDFNEGGSLSPSEMG